jgi:hypothetical protein
MGRPMREAIGGGKRSSRPTSKWQRQERPLMCRSASVMTLGCSTISTR